MLRTYLKLTVRTFWQDKFFTLLNIVGLATGLAVSILILLYLQNDLTYDRHHVNHKRIYRLVTNEKAPGVEFHTAYSAREAAPILAKDLPEIQSFVRFEPINQLLVNLPQSGEETMYTEEGWMYVDSTVFEVFSHSFLAGNPATALQQKNSIVLTESLARKYFGEGEALGKTILLYEEKEAFTVTGVIEDLPDNSHLKFQALVSHIGPRGWYWEEGEQEGEIVPEMIWNADVYTYLMFPAAYDPDAFFEKLTPFYNQYVKPFGDPIGGEFWFYLEPLADIHFHSIQEGDEPQGNYAYVYTFGGIGLFILLLACINYMNLATARSANRVKEIGMRKVLGSSRKALVLSLLGESVLLSVLASLIAVALVGIILYATSFNDLIEKELSLDLWSNPGLLAGVAGITLLMGIVSGLYPAFYLPSLSTVQSLKGGFRSTSFGIALRRSLVTLQFMISISVVICTLLMQHQIYYVQHQELGFDREHLMLIPIQDTLVQQQLPYIKNELEQYDGIVSTTVSYSVPGIHIDEQVFQVEMDSARTIQSFSDLAVGEDYLATMGISLVAGRDFNEDFAGDLEGQSFIINEAAARELGWYAAGQDGAKPEDALGRGIAFFHGQELGRVIGVVRDFNVSSLHNPITPTIIFPVSQPGGYFYARLKGEALATTIEYIEEIWTEHDPNHPFEYSFLDKGFDELYRTDERQSGLISILSGICLLISLLGILGLSAFTAEQRTKEIGVRKVLGASVPHIIYLLFRDVMILVLLAAVLAAPIAYFFIDQWLQVFAYRVTINGLWFVLAGAAALLIAFITMSFHSLKTARRNPVISLRYE